MTIYALLQTDWFWSLLQFIVVLPSLIFIAYQVRLQRFSHYIATLNSLEDQWGSEAMLTARRTFILSKLSKLKGESKRDPAGEYIAEFFEQIALFYQMRALPIMFIWKTFSYYIEFYYCLMEDELKEVRRTANDDTLYADFDKLFESVSSISRRKGGADTRNSQALTEFARRELKITNFSLGLSSSKQDVPLRRHNSIHMKKKVKNS